MNAKVRAQEAVYWHVRRPAGRWGRALIWRLPRRIVYWCVVRAAVAVEPNYNASDVTALQMLEAFGDET